MEYIVGIAAVVFLAVVVYGGLTGRIRGQGCCSIADPRRDARMRDAFEDERSVS